jgi:transposase
VRPPSGRVREGDGDRAAGVPALLVLGAQGPDVVDGGSAVGGGLAIVVELGILPTFDDMFGPGGQELLDEMPFDGAYAIRVESLRDLLEIYERELGMVTRELHRRLAHHAGYQAIRGVEPVVAAIFVAEIGDVTRFPDARHLCSLAGLTPSHRESDTKIQRGHITKQGSNLVRWAAVEAVARYHGGDPIAPAFTRIAKRRGLMIGRVAAARTNVCAAEPDGDHPSSTGQW